MKNLILSYGTNVAWNDFRRFAESLRRRCDPSQTDVSVFLDPLGKEFSQLACDLDIQIVPVSNVWLWTRRSRLLNLACHAIMAGLRTLSQVAPAAQRPFLREAHRWFVSAWVHPAAGRWLVYRDYLQVNSSYGLVMTTDIRDVVFQASPFVAIGSKELHVFDQAGITFGIGESVDGEWYQEVFGSVAAKSMAGRPAACSGTVIGGYGPMVQLLEQMDPLIVKYCRKPLDQAIFNEVIARHLGNLTVVHHDLQSGPVLTLTGDHQGAWEIRDGQVWAGDRVAPVVHMYDRAPETKSHFWELLGPGA